LYICIPNVLADGQLAQLATFFEQEAFVDGQGTGGVAGAGIKSNLQLSPRSAHYGAMERMVSDAVVNNRQFSLAAMPLRMRPIRFARYLPGMQYGRHVDNAVMGKDTPLRTDLAFTLFLSPPDSYEGGELVVEEPGAKRLFKLPAGALVVYPGNTLHQVAEVTAGSRDVAVGWLQSMIRNPDRRRIIFELEELRANMLAQSGRTAEFDVISRNVGDLWRMWVEL